MGKRVVRATAQNPVTLTRELAWLIGEAIALGHVIVAGWTTVHVLLNKRAVGSAVAWIGIAWLSPFLGSGLYFALGINRVKRRARRLRGEREQKFTASGLPADISDNPLMPLSDAIGRLTGLPLAGGNDIRLLKSGDEAYPAMVAAIDGATESVGLTSYIFRDDAAGAKFVAALARAHARGVAVRVLIDGVGGGWFKSGVYEKLRMAEVPVARFLHSYFPWRMPFLNLRTHRKLMTIDGRGAFTGGINIGAENVLADRPLFPVRDTHFRVDGPVVGQLVDTFADDWLFATGERLAGEVWFPQLAPRGQTAARVVTSGPDEDFEQIEVAALHAISCARQSIRIVTPYFLPPEILTTTLALAAMRGLAVDIVVPEQSNHTVLDWARRIPLRHLIDAGCRVWLAPAPFAHSKLMIVDDAWSLVGSANWDTRSFRLNFELNVEVQGAEFARRLAGILPAGRPLTRAELDADTLTLRLRNAAARLLQPYL